MIDDFDIARRNMICGIIIMIIFLAALMWTSPTTHGDSYFTHDTSKTFVKDCNELYGEPSWNNPTWGLFAVDDYTSYSFEFWQDHPRIYVDDKCYTCFEINN